MTQWINLSGPVELEVLGAPMLEPFPGAALYELVRIPGEMKGRRFRGELRGLSLNGVLIRSELLPPLLSRLALALRLGNGEQVIAIGLLLGRCFRRGELVEPGFFLLFEAVPLKTRQRIAAFISAATTTPPAR
jgi:hypothetical protein